MVMRRAKHADNTLLTESLILRLPFHIARIGTAYTTQIVVFERVFDIEPRDRVSKCHRYGRYICEKILKNWGKKCVRIQNR